MMTNPYPGLRAFEYAENHLFFGREGHAQKIANRLEQNHFVAVVGTSGSGKSSVVRAGLLPLLYGGRMFGSNSHWKISLMRPGDRPIHNLAKSLVHPEKFDDSGQFGGGKNTPKKNEAQVGIVETILRRSGVGLVDFLKTAELEDGENLLIVVDQFEELFRFKEKMRVGHADEAAAFVKLLLEATKDKQNRIYIITTMRSDFLGDCAEFRGLPEAINDGQYLVSRMTRNQLRSSIESPAKVFDAEVSPVLVNHLLNKLEDDSNLSLEFRERMLQDQLPVMQHALMRTWDEWESRNTPNEQIGMEHYKAVGGMQKALLNHANEAFEELTDRQKTIAEKMFKCLTEKDEEHRETRRPTTVGEICAVAEAEKEEVFAVIEVFRQEGRTFLMPPPSTPLTANTKIDISHESLIRNWDVLKKWVEEEAKDAWHYRRLSEAANEWVYEKDKDEDFLWRGRVIEEATKWWTSFSPNQIWAKRYQTLNDREKAQLAEISRTSPDEEPIKRQNLMAERFNEAELFLAESQNYEIHEQDRKERLRQAEARGRYTKWLATAAVLLFLLLGATTYFAYNAVMTGRELIAKNDSLKKEQDKLKEAQNKLNEINEALKKSNDEEVKQRKEADTQREKAEVERRNALAQKERADREAQQAKISENQAKISENQAKINADRAKEAERKAQENFKNAKIAGERAEKLAETLKMSRDGFVNIEYENFVDAKANFEQYLGATGEQDQKFGKWWGTHNLAITNWNLSKETDDTGEFAEAERKFIDALRVLGYDENILLEIESKNNENQDPTINFSPISYNKTRVYKNQNTNETEKSIIITLRKFAKFYRDFATNTELNKKAKCFPPAAMAPFYLNDGESLIEKYKVPCLKYKANLLYTSLLNRNFDNTEIKADIQTEYAQPFLVSKGDEVKSREAIKLYDLALESYKQNDRTSKYIARQSEVVKYFLTENNIDEANDRANQIIEVKKVSLMKRSGETPTDKLNALTSKEFEDIYLNLNKIYSERLSEYIEGYGKRINEQRNEWKKDSEVKDLLDKLSNNIINYGWGFKTRDYQRILISDIKFKVVWERVFDEKFPADKFEKLSNRFRLFIDGEEMFGVGDNKQGLAETYFLRGQCKDAFFILEQWLKTTDKNEISQNSNEIERFVALADSAEFYHKYNYKDKAKKTYEEFYDHYEKIVGNIDQSIRKLDTSQSNITEDYIPDILRKAGRFFFFELKDNEKALTLFKESERRLKSEYDADDPDPYKTKSIMRMQLYIGFALEPENPFEAIDHYKTMRAEWSNYRKNLKNQDSPYNRETEELNALDILLRIRLAELYLENNEPQKADEILCNSSDKKDCIDSIRFPEEKGLTIIYPEKYLQGIRAIAEYKKNQEKSDEALAYLYYAVEIFGRLKADYSILEINQFFFSGVYFHDFIYDRSHRPTEKFLTDHIGVLEALQEIEPPEKREWIENDINSLKNEINYLKNSTEQLKCEEK